MTYASVVTSKGTITIPAQVRKNLGLTEGVRVTIEQNADGQVVVKRMPDLQDLRTRNRAHMQKVGTWPAKTHPNDQGFVDAIQQKHGPKA